MADGDNPPAASVPLPPVLLPLTSQLEWPLTKPELLPIHQDYRERFNWYWRRSPEPQRLLHTSPAPLQTTLRVERNMTTGEVIGLREDLQPDAGCTPKNSTSLSRAPGPPDQPTRGNTGNFPFWPGGFELNPEEEGDDPEDPEEDIDDLFDPSKFLTCPPGFEHGLNFSADGSKSILNVALDEMSRQGDDTLEGLWNAPTLASPENDIPSEGSEARSSHLESDSDEFPMEDTGVPMVPPATGVVSLSVKQSQRQIATEWAEMIDISHPMHDFHVKVPKMAYTWPFELDTFQKQAVYRLERNESVFVAAHTSAGKTVVAEYAIALSQKHMTRTIYTSPIKALSNQKFRDFKDTFNDVGLVTGDIQINPTATCLIMTTEILRSMLYNGSDIIRDLEYVIFDEVHYINDPERGVVWEEVLILLPDHVSIIMLSATVPNTMDFADWVGRTKQKKIYVISTLKRPIPLEHFLYTGSNAKSRDELWLLQDSAGRFRPEAHARAVQAKKDRESKNKAQFGAKGTRDRVGPNAEKNIWLTLVNFLSLKDKLPVVAFTLSRNRCDQNANLLTSLDLTTAMEKSDIHHFILKCVQRLKGSDRKLPQVIQLTELLKRGIGIHHSGILPILKEVVEMLFQKGWVKLLFATETFAMGVNMPARTVVFDNIRKHDGTQFRSLLPAEYIQMAGRAGRRGLDSTGTVIILCKGDVHELSDLHSMMQGKPMQLESKFRLTYSMILNLLRVEQLRVEDMMKRSFAEIGTQKKASGHKKKVKKLKARIAELPRPSGAFSEELESFYTLAAEYMDLKESLWTLLLSHPVVVKMLVQGRIVLIKHEHETNKPAMLLSVDTKSREKTYTVLTLVGDKDDFKDNLSPKQSGKHSFADFLALAPKEPGPAPSYVSRGQHVILKLTDQHLLDISTKQVKVDGDKIINDVKKREIPRFKDDPPGPTTAAAIQDIIKATQAQAAGTLGVVNLLKDLHVQEFDLLQKLQSLATLKQKLKACECTSVPDFIGQFSDVYERMSLEQELKDVEWLLSEESLSMLPDYHNRIKVLKQIRYIDSNHTVQLKGRVACEMGNHELLVTELVFNNVLTDRPPGEIAALLSCLVFQQRKCSAPELTSQLEQGIADIKRCAEIVGTVQKECGMLEPVQEYVDQFNFGLVEVVHEWAKGMPFSEITSLTDVQEGIVVRTIQRLDEALRDVKDAARVIGDPVLYQKMDEASTLIKRDIVFAASLYTQ